MSKIDLFKYKKDGSSIYRWINVMTKNTFIDHVRKKQTSPLDRVTAESIILLDKEYDKNKDLAWKQITEIVEKDYENKKINPKYYDLYRLKYVKGYNNKEINYIMGIDTKKGKYFRKKLTKYLRTNKEIRTILLTNLETNYEI